MKWRDECESPETITKKYDYGLLGRDTEYFGSKLYYSIFPAEQKQP